jgi:histidinol-phosphate aminotransferase
MNRFVRSAIAKMTGYVPGEQPGQAKFIKLNTNENPFPPSPNALEAIRQAASDSLARYPDPGAMAFRLVLSDRYGISPDSILCGNGSDDILTICTRAFVAESDLVRFPYPSYTLYHTLAEIQGARSESVPFEKDGSLGDVFTEPASSLKLAFVPNPNSPTGTWISPPQILEMAQQLPCPLVVDEAYADFADESCIPLISQSEKLLVTRTLSKSYALAGLRFGYVVGHPNMIAELAKVKDSYNCDALSIAGATAAISDQPWLEENTRQVIANRGALSASLVTLGFDVLPSSANFVWCRHESKPAKQIYEALKERGLLVRYLEFPNWGDGLRISVGTESQQQVLFQLLSEILV